MQLNESCTVLKDRILWFDGDSSFEPKLLLQQLLQHNTIKNAFVTDTTREIIQYNKLVPRNEQLGIKTELKPFDFSWNIPTHYQTLNVAEYIWDKFIDECDGMDTSSVKERKERVVYELGVYKSMKLMDVLRTIIFVIETFRTQNVVWGVGRGSSVSSYVLFLIGVHDVDSVLYDLDVHDFLHK